MSVTQQQIAKYTIAKADREERLVAALEGMVAMYVRLARSNHWNPENVPEVIAARAALAS